MNPVGEKKSIWAHLRAETALILVVSSLTFVVHRAGVLDRFESTALDFMLQVRPPVRAETVWVVGIDKNDYATMVGTRGLLDADKLRELIAAIAAGGPRVIGIDIDTSAPEDLHKVRPAITNDVRLVWGQSFDSMTETGSEEVTLNPLPVLGGEVPQPSTESLGIVALPVKDHDGRVRRYARGVPIPHREADTLPWAVVKAFCLSVFDDPAAPPDLVKRCEHLYRSEHELTYRTDWVLPFMEPPRLLSAGAVMEAAEHGTWKEQEAPFKGAIVLLGGIFPQANDLHPTPQGEMTGVELLAKATETEFQSKLLTPANEWLMVLCELAGGYLLVAWHFYAAGFVAFIVRVALMPILAVALSFLAFFSLAYWANFVPVLCGVLIHEAYQHIRHHQQMIRQLHRHPQRATHSQ